MATTVTTAESDWARAHPVPESSVSDNLLMLWNYPVAKSALATVHKNAIQRFLAIEWLAGPANASAELTVHGHASDTGDPKLNATLARDRAQNVAQFLRAQGVRSKLIFVSSAGAAEPFASESSGLAFAKNRRVDVTKHTPALPEPPLPPLLGSTPEPSSPESSAPPAPSPSGPLLPTLSATWIEIVIPIKLLPHVTPTVIIKTTIEFTVKVKVDDKSGGLGVGAAAGGGKLKLEQPIREWLTGKINFERGNSKTPPSLKIGAEFSALPGKPEVGTNPTTLIPYVNLTFAESNPFDFVLKGKPISIKISVKIKSDLLPGPTTVAWSLRTAAAVAAAPAAATAAAATSLGAIGVAVLILGATYYAIQDAKEEADKYSRLLAEREGASSRLAWEIIVPDVEVAFLERRSRWRNPQMNMVGAFDDGRRWLEARFGKPAERSAKGKAWKARFASDGTQDFTLIRERVFQAIGGYNKDGAINDALAAL